MFWIIKHILTNFLFASVSKGISGHLLKTTSKRRRGKFQIEEEKRQKLQAEQDTQRRLA